MDEPANSEEWIEFGLISEGFRDDTLSKIATLYHQSCTAIVYVQRDQKGRVGFMDIPIGVLLNVLSVSYGDMVILVDQKLADEWRSNWINKRDS